MSLATCELNKFNRLNQDFQNILTPIENDKKDSVICELIATYQYKNLVLRLQLQKSQIGAKLQEIANAILRIGSSLQGRIVSISIEGPAQYIADRNSLLQIKISEARQKIQLEREILELQREKEALIKLILQLKKLDESIRLRIDTTKIGTQDIIQGFENTTATLQAHVMDVLFQNYQYMKNFQQTQLEVHQAQILTLTSDARANRDSWANKCRLLQGQIREINDRVTRITGSYQLIQQTTDIPFPVASILSEPLLSTYTAPVGASLLFIEDNELHIKNYSTNPLSLDDHFLLSFTRDKHGLIRMSRLDLRLRGSNPVRSGDVLIIQNHTKTGSIQGDDFDWSPHNYWIELYKQTNTSSVAVTRIHNITVSSTPIFTVPTPITTTAPPPPPPLPRPTNTGFVGIDIPF
jgi:hypothetical protein